MDPLSLTMGAGSSISAPGGAAGPSHADLHGGDSFFDSSNWTVSTGGRTPNLTTLLVLGALGLGALLIWKRA